MTKFRFPLGRVLDFRRLRADVARAAVDRLQAQRQRLIAEERELLAMRAEEEGAVRKPGTELNVTQLDALDGLQTYVAVARQRIGQQHRQLDQSIAQAQAAVVEADRQVGLLEKLETRQHADWKVLFNKELEELAADSYLSRYYRESKLRRPPI